MPKVQLVVVGIDTPFAPDRSTSTACLGAFQQQDSQGHIGHEHGHVSSSAQCMICLRCAVGKISLHRHHTHGPHEYAKQTVNTYMATTQLQRNTSPIVSTTIDSYLRGGADGNSKAAEWQFGAAPARKYK